jgi:hypothetical protein
MSSLNPEPQHNSQDEETLALSEVSKAIEKAIQLVISETGSMISGKRLLRHLSTSPEKTELDFPELFGMCTTISSALAEILRKDLHFDAHMSQNPYALTSHRYIVVEQNGQELIVDPTLGQFILGHNHIFVGTRAELRKLVTQAAHGEHPLYTVNDFLTRVKNFTPEMIFDAVWGKTSHYLD